MILTTYCGHVCYVSAVQDRGSMVQQHSCTNSNTTRQGNQWFPHKMMKFEAVFLLTEFVGRVSNGRAGVAGALMQQSEKCGNLI